MLSNVACFMHCFVPCTTMCVVWSDMQVNKERLNICFYSDSRTPYSTIYPHFNIRGFHQYYTNTSEIQRFTQVANKANCVIYQLTLDNSLKEFFKVTNSSLLDLPTPRVIYQVVLSDLKIFNLLTTVHREKGFCLKRQLDITQMIL